MSNSRQPAAPLVDPIDVRSFAANYLTSSSTGWHAHDWHQLVFAQHGLVEVHARGGCWVVPPNRGVWVPAGFEHRLETVACVELRTVYLRPDDDSAKQPACRVLEVTPLLREIVLQIVRQGVLRADVPADRHLKGVLLDQLSATASLALELPLPRDPALREIAKFISAHLGDPDVVALALRGGSTSRRTLERRFREQVHMSLGKWVQLARLIQAVRGLGQETSVTNVALDVGYESVSAFIAAFKRHFGVTPSKYFDRPKAARDSV